MKKLVFHTVILAVCYAAATPAFAQEAAKQEAKETICFESRKGASEITKHADQRHNALLGSVNQHALDSVHVFDDTREQISRSRCRAWRGDAVTSSVTARRASSALRRLSSSPDKGS